ncbi:MAG: GIY-YIG nuclease family protein [Alcanivoracaceae bacterium]
MPALTDLPLPPFTPDPDLFRELPGGPGVYRFHGEADALLYIGKSINIRDRVKSHFSARHRDRREHRMAWLTRRISVTETAGELGALLLENHEIKTRLPLFNRRQRRPRHLYTWWQSRAADGLLQLQISQPLGDHQPWHQTGYGVFRSLGQARQTLETLVRDHQLCRKALQLEAGSGPCFARQLHRCSGVCDGRESVESHNQRLLTALAPLSIEAWPHPGPLVLEEVSADGSLRDFHAVHQWRWLGSAASHDAAMALAAVAKPGQFDLDSYRILLRYWSHQGK